VTVVPGQSVAPRCSARASNPSVAAIGVGIPALRLVGRDGQLTQLAPRLEFGDRCAIEQRHGSTQRLVQRHVLAQLCLVIRCDDLQETSADEGRGCPDPALPFLEETETFECELGFVRVGIVQPHQCPRFPGCPRSGNAALDDEHIPHPELGQPVGDARADDSCSDDHHLSSRRHAFLPGRGHPTSSLRAGQVRTLRGLGEMAARASARNTNQLEYSSAADERQQAHAPGVASRQRWMLAASFSVRFRNGQQHSRWCSCSPVGPAPRSRSASRGACCGDKRVREGKTALHGRTGTQGASSAIVRGTRNASPCGQRIDGEDARLISRGGSRRTSLPFFEEKTRGAPGDGALRAPREGKGLGCGSVSGGASRPPT
jgi:hypothetical protein